MRRCLLISVFFLFISIAKTAAQQPCDTLGQNSTTAFPVCGDLVFHQSSVPICTGYELHVPGCSGTGADYENKNPYWYKFTCYVTGTLEFTIVPNVNSDDYDWQLWDITGHPPNAVYSNPNLVVTGNWSGSPGNTGASASGVNFIQCASDPNGGAPTFSQPPTIIEGHDYLLLISHFTDTQSGYSLTFGGGTGSITDPKIPKMENASSPCDASVVVINLNKRMKCNSISTAEFTIEPPIATVTGVSGVGCSSSFDMDQVSLTLSTGIPPGNYMVRIHNGSDGNTLLDNCDHTIADNDSIPLTIAPIFPTPMDSLTKIGCAPGTLELVFQKHIRCNSIATNGSDFIVTGPYPVTVTAAEGSDCEDLGSYKILVHLNAPLYVGGNFQIKLQTGTDGNTLIDECGLETPAGQFINFAAKDTVNADFNYSIAYGCQYDTVRYFHNAAHGVSSWLWNFDNLFTSTLQNPVVAYNIFGIKETQLIVSNGVCSDTTLQSVLLNNTLKAKFDVDPLVCPNDPVKFTDASIGLNLQSWSWDFANGNTSSLQNPPLQHYIEQPVDYFAPVRLAIEDVLGCRDTTIININILHNCYVAVPTAFTPNGDGLNDFLYPINAYKSSNMHFSVYNRMGQRIFYSENWLVKWNGKIKGQDADPGTYVWILDFFNLHTNKHVFQKGTSILIR